VAGGDTSSRVWRQRCLATRSTRRARARCRRGAHLLTLLCALLELSDLGALGVERHLHQEHLALLGDELTHVLLLLAPIARGSGNEVELRLLQRRAAVAAGQLGHHRSAGVLLDALLPHMLLLRLLTLGALALRLLVAQREYLLVDRHVERVVARHR
jgi:hypothetical protein